MKVATAMFGTLEVSEQTVIQFDKSLYGLENFKSFVLVQPDETLPFAYLQSTEDAEVCLLLADPFDFYPNYEFDLAQEEVIALKNPQSDKIAIWVTVSAKDTINNGTINLLAPLVINTEQRIAKQVVLHNSLYETRVPLFPRQKEGA